MFEARKRRVRSRFVKLLPPHLLPGEQMRILAFVVKNDFSVGYWLPIVLIGGFAIWACRRDNASFPLIALLVLAANMLSIAHGRWIVLTDRSSSSSR